MELKQKAIVINSNWAEVNALANIYVEQQQWSEAAAAYRCSIELNPKFFWSYHNLGDVLVKLQQWDEAAIIYRRAVELDPKFFWSHHNLGDVLIKLQQWDEAIAAYLNAIQVKPDLATIYQKLGIALKQRASLNESIGYYRQVIRYPDRYPLYQKALGFVSTRPELLFQIGNFLAQEHQVSGAIIFYYMLLEIAPEEVEILRRIEKLLEKHNRLERNITANQRRILPDIDRLSLSQPFLNPSPSNTSLSTTTGRILFSNDRRINPRELEELCQIVGWSPRPLDKVKIALKQSFCIIGIWEIKESDRRLIGFARATSDYAFHATLLDLVIHPDFQGRGLGKTAIAYLVKRLRSAGIKDITLFAHPKVVDFYHSLGFISEPNDLKWMLWCSE